MLFKYLARRTHKMVASKPFSTPNDYPAECHTQTEQRHDIYERIAEGNALAEAEDYAKRMWGPYGG